MNQISERGMELALTLTQDMLPTADSSLKRTPKIIIYC
jgi:hypothetical protein